MIRFYCPDIEDSPVMPEIESGHCVRVLRHKPGDLLEVVDGKGVLYEVKLVDANPRHALVEIVSRREIEPYWKGRLVLCVAPTKMMDRMEWLVEKATEVGLDEFVPMLCRYSERKDIKCDRLEKTAVSAMKQSLKAAMPQIEPMTPIAQVIDRYSHFAQKFIAYCTDDGERRLLTKEYIPGSDAVILIGPEGDFSPEEVKLAVECGFQPVTFGNTRLRTETAALYAVAAVHVLDNLTPTACGVE